MDPAVLFFIGRRCHHHQHVTKRLATGHTVDWIAVDRHQVIVAIAQDEALGVGLGIGPQIADLRDAVHGQGSLIGPANGLVGVEQDHPVGQPGDDLLQLATIGFGGQDVLAHCDPTSMVTL